MMSDIHHISTYSEVLTRSTLAHTENTNRFILINPHEPPNKQDVSYFLKGSKLPKQ